MRLIDADKYKEEIMLIMQCWSVSPALSSSEADRAKGNLRTALNVLSDMPTAYDVDKVIKKIKELPTHTFETYSQGYPMDEDFIDPCDVIKIVKSGGVEND